MTSVEFGRIALLKCRVARFKFRRIVIHNRLPELHASIEQQWISYTKPRHNVLRLKAVIVKGKDSHTATDGDVGELKVMVAGSDVVFCVRLLLSVTQNHQ